MLRTILFNVWDAKDYTKVLELFKELNGPPLTSPTADQIGSLIGILSKYMQGFSDDEIKLFLAASILFESGSEYMENFNLSGDDISIISKIKHMISMEDLIEIDNEMIHDVASIISNDELTLHLRIAIAREMLDVMARTRSFNIYEGESTGTFVDFLLSQDEHNMEVAVRILMEGRYVCAKV